MNLKLMELFNIKTTTTTATVATTTTTTAAKCSKIEPFRRLVQTRFQLRTNLTQMLQF